MMHIAAALASVALATAHTQLTARFTRSSAPAGGAASLAITADARAVSVELIAAAPSPERVENPRIVVGPVVGSGRTFRWRPGEHVVSLRVPPTASGVYFARVRSSDGGLAFAPLVVHPARLGATRVAVVLPTYSWQAYNFRDGDSWYVCACVRTVDLTRPYAGLGVPPNFRQYNLGFLQWLAYGHHRVDYLSDQDLERIASGSALRRLYDLVVFAGHEEYDTGHEYDIVRQYRDLGGRLAFLSADNFYRAVTVADGRMTLLGRWRDLGRPEAALIGVQYLDWDHNRWPNRPYVVVGVRRLPWLFRGTGLRNGSLLRGSFGIEIDARTAASPPGTSVAAEIPNAFGPGETAEMTYYATHAGARVFAAGTMNLGGSATLPTVSKLLDNLWRQLAPPHS